MANLITYSDVYRGITPTNRTNMQTLFQRTPHLSTNNPEAKREEIRQYFHATFDRYESLFETLVRDEAYYKKPISLRHPLIFYFGHTATFFINKLLLAGAIDQRINPQFESMFAVGVDEMSWDDLNDQHYDWPPVDAVRAYRRQVRDTVDQLMATLPAPQTITWESPWWILLMGIEHERIHLETSSVLIRQHALDFVQSISPWNSYSSTGETQPNILINIEQGAVDIGKKTDDDTYGWDNEYGRHAAEVPAFQVSQSLVSNAEFMSFVEAGGYGDDRVWEAEGLAWRNFAHAEHPTFWVRDGEHWRLRLMTEEIAMPWDWPVEVNYHEAKAFCLWRQRETGQMTRLPTEDEWYRMLAVAGMDEVPEQHPVQANLHLDHYTSPCSVTRFRQGPLYDVVGNVWQWTETPIYPFEGFKVHPCYDDFTTPTFDNRHNLIKGGSWISCGNEALQSARYAFRRHFFQHAGFRYVVSDTPLDIKSSNYETDKLLSEYAEFHYGDRYFDVPNFPKALSDLAIQAMGTRPARKALDLGCATGRATFELARHFDHVTGIDFSARFIGLGVQLASQGVIRYTLTDEGELVSYKERTLAGLGLESTRDKVEFWQGDACNLKPHFTGYDLILAANLIDRLYNPRKFLSEVHERLNPGGLLLIASPYTWLEEHTAREEWIGGFKQAGENFTTFDGLNALLGRHFTLLQGPQEVPFVIRETRRKFQHTLSEVTIWEKK